MLEQLRKLNEENENLHRNMSASRPSQPSLSNLYDSSIHDDEDNEVQQYNDVFGGEKEETTVESKEVAELLAMKEAMLLERQRLLEENERMK